MKSPVRLVLSLVFNWNSEVHAMEINCPCHPISIIVTNRTLDVKARLKRLYFVLNRKLFSFLIL